MHVYTACVCVCMGGHVCMHVGVYVRPSYLPDVTFYWTPSAPVDVAAPSAQMTGIRSVECLHKHRAETKHQNFTAINELQLADIYFIQ